MTDNPDIRPGDVGDTDTTALAPLGGGDRLSQRARDREVGQRLERRLPGGELPDVELQTPHAVRVPLLRHIVGRVVVEFFPGDGIRGPTQDAASEQRVMRSRQEHADGLRVLAQAEIRTITVISDPPRALNLQTTFIDPHGLLFCDPDLLIADAMALPISDKSGVRRYQRLTLVTKNGRIAKVIFPPDENFDSHVRRLMSWMQAARW